MTMPQNQVRAMKFKESHKNANHVGLKYKKRLKGNKLYPIGRGSRIDYTRTVYVKVDPHLSQIAHNQEEAEKRANVRRGTGLFNNPLSPRPVVIGVNSRARKKQKYKAITRRPSVRVNRKPQTGNGMITVKVSPNRTVTIPKPTTPQQKAGTLLYLQRLRGQ